MFSSQTFWLGLFFILLFHINVTPSCRASEPDTSISHAANKRANRAILFSAILPGAGQVYNHKYWKVPIIYGGFGALIYFIQTNNTEYLKFQTALRYRTDEDPLTIDNYPRLTNDDLSVRKDYYRRNRDLSYILTGVLYVLNIVDAYVDSQLMNFDVGDNLSIRSSPGIFPSDDGKNYAGVGLIITLK